MPFNWGSVVGNVIGAGANLLGGFLGDKSAQGMNRQNISFAREQMAAQKEFAKQGIRWKVEDARRAGIHPLYAVGAPAQSPSPVALNFQPQGNMARGIAAAGQNVSRAVQATMTDSERIGTRLAEAQLEGQLLANEGQAIENRAKSSQLPPAMPGDRAPGKIGIQSTFLDPPSRDSQGNRIIHTAQGPLTYSGAWTPAQETEDIVGDVMAEIIMAVNMGDLALDQAQRRLDRLSANVRSKRRAPSLRSRRTPRRFEEQFERR